MKELNHKSPQTLILSGFAALCFGKTMSSQCAMKDFSIFFKKAVDESS